MEKYGDKIPQHMNPYVKLDRIDKIAYKLTMPIKENNNNINDGESENKSNALIENMMNVQIVLERVKIFNCRKCSACFLNINDYRLHSAVHAAPVVKNEFSYDKYNSLIKRHTCNECGKKFVEESTLKEHSIVHQPFPHICHCGIGYYKEKDLKGHQDLVHAKHAWTPKTAYTGPKIKPEFCIKTESEPTEVTIEINNSLVTIGKIVYKNGVKKFSCIVCKKGLLTKSALEVHRRIHTGEKPFTCEKCDKSYADYSTLKKHVNYYCH